MYKFSNGIYILFNLITQNNKNCSLIFWILQLYINIIIKNKKYLVDNIYKFSNGIDIYIYTPNRSSLLDMFFVLPPIFVPNQNYGLLWTNTIVAQLKRVVSSSYHTLDEGGDQQFCVKSLKMQMTIILAQKVVRMVCSGTPLQC